MKIIICGTTRQYACKPSEKPKIQTKNYSDVDNINAYDTISHIGSLHVGGILGMRKTLNRDSTDFNSLKPIIDELER